MSRVDAVPAPLLVLGGVLSVQFGGALAATLVPQIGAAGSVVLRLGIATVLLVLIARPRWRGHSRRDLGTIICFGLAMGLMNFAFYASLGHLPIGVAVTIEFVGPLTLAAVLSRRPRDLLAVAAAGVGVLLISRALSLPLEQLEVTGIALALAAGVCWAAYIVFSGRTGAAFPQLEGLALAMVVATAVVLPFGLWDVARHGTEAWDAEVLLKGLGIAVLSSVLPYSLELFALRRLAPAVFGILLSLEPAVAALAGLLVLGQRLSPVQLLGMGLVVLASVLVLGLGARRPPPQPAA
ncbi:EamA family transporter [Janibacter anophelis]|uniref:EamA family transporter n=1 Tax=Janibacter anophelis TaxID=319054 RepID=UPI003F80EB4E